MSDFWPLTYQLEIESAKAQDGSGEWTVGSVVKSITSYYEPDDGAWLCIVLNDGREIRAAARYYFVTLKAKFDNAPDAPQNATPGEAVVSKSVQRRLEIQSGDDDGVMP